MSDVAPLINRRILVIDDNPEIHGDFRKVILGDDARTRQTGELEAFFDEGSGAEPIAAEVPFEIGSALQGKDGLAKVVEAGRTGVPYALAFVDGRMPPGWDGVETIKRLWEADDRLQAVLCTAYSDRSWEEIRAGLGGHADRLLILKKPFDGVEVRQLAYSLTEKWVLAERNRLARAQLENELVRRTKELEDGHARLLVAQKLESLGQLAAGIAHEINTPTQYVSDNLHFLKEAFESFMLLMAAHAQVRDAAKGHISADLIGEVTGLEERVDLPFMTDAVPEALSQSLDGISRIAEIVRAMKQFSHPGGRDKAPVDINDALRATMAVTRNEWKYLAEIETDLDPALPTIMGFAGELNQVFLNILVNASHALAEVAGPEGKRGLIRLATRSLGDAGVEIRIADNGPGIPEAIRSRIYDPFFTTKPVGKGTGQGLAIARDVVVHKHQGHLECVSSEGEGTTFIIRLPRG